MKRCEFVRKTYLALVLLAIAICVINSPLSAQSAIATSGASRTLLPDGRVLITGGQAQDGSLLREAFIVNPATGVSLPLKTTLNIARSWHTATVLPDGTVLILGGIGNDGRVGRAGGDI